MSESGKVVVTKSKLDGLANAINDKAQSPGPKTIAQLTQTVANMPAGVIPEIGANGNWYINGADTGKPSRGATGAQGDTGVSITDTVLNADYTLTVQFSDGSSYTSPSIRGAAGPKGVTFIPSVTADGTMRWTNNGGMTNPEPVNLRGPAGKDGANGKDAAADKTLGLTGVVAGQIVKVKSVDATGKPLEWESVTGVSLVEQSIRSKRFTLDPSAWTAENVNNMSLYTQELTDTFFQDTDNVNHVYIVTPIWSDSYDYTAFDIRPYDMLGTDGSILLHCTPINDQPPSKSLDIDILKIPYF